MAQGSDEAINSVHWWFEDSALFASSDTEDIFYNMSKLDANETSVMQTMHGELGRQHFLQKFCEMGHAESLAREVMLLTTNVNGAVMHVERTGHRLRRALANMQCDVTNARVEDVLRQTLDLDTAMKLLKNAGVTSLAITTDDVEPPAAPIMSQEVAELHLSIEDKLKIERKHARALQTSLNLQQKKLKKAESHAASLTKCATKLLADAKKHSEQCAVPKLEIEERELKLQEVNQSAMDLELEAKVVSGQILIPDDLASPEKALLPKCVAANSMPETKHHHVRHDLGKETKNNEEINQQKTEPHDCTPTKQDLKPPPEDQSITLKPNDAVQFLGSKLSSHTEKPNEDMSFETEPHKSSCETKSCSMKKQGEKEVLVETVCEDSDTQLSIPADDTNEAKGAPDANELEHSHKQTMATSLSEPRTPGLEESPKVFHVRMEERPFPCKEWTLQKPNGVLKLHPQLKVNSVEAEQKKQTMNASIIKGSSSSASPSETEEEEFSDEPNVAERTDDGWEEEDRDGEESESAKRLHGKQSMFELEAMETGEDDKSEMSSSGSQTSSNFNCDAKHESKCSNDEESNVECSDDEPLKDTDSEEDNDKPNFKKDLAARNQKKRTLLDLDVQSQHQDGPNDSPEILHFVREEEQEVQGNLPHVHMVPRSTKKQNAKLFPDVESDD